MSSPAATLLGLPRHRQLQGNAVCAHWRVRPSPLPLLARTGSAPSRVSSASCFESLPMSSEGKVLASLSSYTVGVHLTLLRMLTEHDHAVWPAIMIRLKCRNFCSATLIYISRCSG
jgi:hypothetical protein